MKYVSLDLETTGLDPKSDQILQISMVVEDTTEYVPVQDLPHFTAFIKHDRIIGNAYALGMNGWILDIISGRAKNATGYPILGVNILHEWVIGKLDSVLYEFLKDHFGDSRITVAGKNVAGFDMPFLPQSLQSKFRHRVIDVGSLYFDPATDDQVPDLKTCLERAGLDTTVSHDAREDAIAVISCIRAINNNYQHLAKEVSK